MKSIRLILATRSAAHALLVTVMGWATWLTPVVVTQNPAVGQLPVGLPPALKNEPSLAPSLRRAVDAITPDSVLSHIKILCDPILDGREAGMEGARKAGNYVAAKFREFGLRPGGSAGTYFQNFKIQPGYRIRSKLTMTADQAEEFELERTAHYMPVHLPGQSIEVSLECVLAGYGVTAAALKFDDYAGTHVKDRAVIVFSGVPWSVDASGWLNRIDSRDHESLAAKGRNAADHGAKLLLVVDNPAGWRSQLGASEQLRLPDPRFPLKCPIPVIHIKREIACKLVGVTRDELRVLAETIVRDRQPRSTGLPGIKLDYSAQINGRARVGRNVIGVLPGRDPKLRAETVVIGAHYDHLGADGDEIYFGANDNASGVGAMLEIARVTAALRERPDRSIVFIAFGAEEIGKLGSKHYTQHPTMPIEKTRLMINFDMIGRNEADQVNAIGTRSSPGLHTLHQEMNEHVGLLLSHPESMRLGRSDHSPFFYARVPILYFFGGKHDGYHTPRDTVDKLVPKKITRVARLAFLTAHAASSRNVRLLFDGVGSP